MITMTITTAAAALIAIETFLPLAEAASSIPWNRIMQPRKTVTVQRRVLRSTTAQTYMDRLDRGPC
jgi:23S rRNA G2445 N2-methylase RlmL